MRILKIQQANSFNKKRARLSDIENKLVVTSEEREAGRGKIGGTEWEVQTTGCKVTTRMYLYNTWNTANIL